MPEHKLNVTHIVNTPEGIDIEFAVAGPVVRALAWLIDFAIRAVLFVALAYMLSPFFEHQSSEFLAGMMSIGYFLLEWFYPTLFEAGTGTTPGKKIMKLRVVQDDGTPLTLPSAVIRNFLRAADFLPLFYATGLIAMVCNSSFKRLGDLAAGTLVIYQTKRSAFEAFTHTDARPLPGGLNTADKLNVVRFAERSASLSMDRQIELANLLHNITGQTGEPAVDTLKAWAHWIINGQQHAETSAI